MQRLHNRRFGLNFAPRWGFALIVGALLLAVLPASAQAANRVAFVSSSGQLIIGSGDGGFRWIVTNPGERLVPSLGFTWAPRGDQLFFAVDQGGEVSLRIAEIAAQATLEIGRVGGSGLSGGEWTADGRAVLIAANDAIRLYAADGSGPTAVVTGQGAVRVISPFVTERPNLPTQRSLAPDDRYLLFQGAGGRYAVQTVSGGSPTITALTNNADAAQVGLWSDVAPLVAYWGSSGTSQVAVTNAATGETLTLDSGRTAPITPIGWRPGTTQLAYRGADGGVRLADLGCLEAGCGSNPLNDGVALLPATAANIQLDQDWAYFSDGEAIQALGLDCAAAGNCQNAAFTLGANAAPQTLMHIAGARLVYTAYTQNATDITDREVRLLDLGCLNNPSSCAPQPVFGGAVAGLLSADGAFVTISIRGDGIYALDLARIDTAYLTDLVSGTDLLLTARWN
ncbi:MAG: hypothetical protein GYB67_12245 [Chloroflexi bacterium]|nr:hypothetical protein [Chloroflexota bacterium]